jgi:hypothetical protein
MGVRALYFGFGLWARDHRKRESNHCIYLLTFSEQGICGVNEVQLLERVELILPRNKSGAFTDIEFAYASGSGVR